MFLSGVEKRGLETSIGDASSYGRWLIEQYGETSSGSAVTENTALTLTYAYAAIKVLSETLAHVPLELMKMGNKGPERKEGHPLFNMLRWQPSDMLTSYNMRNVMEGHRNGWGNCYARIVRDGGSPVALELLYPDRTEPGLLESGDLVYRTRQDMNSVSYEQLPAVDVLHIPGLGFNGLAGYSPVQLAKETIGIGLAIHQFGASFFKNGASTKGIIESEMPANTMNKWAAEFKRMFGGLDNAHGTPVLPKGLTYKPTTINPDDAQTLETLKYNRTEVAALYRVPPHFIMDLERSTFTNAVEMDLHFVKHTMMPIMVNWEQELNRKLLTASERRRGFYFKFNVMGLLRGDTKARFDAYHIALQDGWLNRNEVRAMEDRQEVNGLEVFLEPNNMVKPGDSDEPAPGESNGDEAMVESLAQRMASAERRTIERGSDLAEFYSSKYPEFIRRHVTPLVTMIEHRHGADLMYKVDDFIEAYIARQMEKEPHTDSVNEGEIMNTFYEVMRYGT